MRVISNWDAEHGNIEVEMLTESHKGQLGKIVGHNGKSMKYGRLYNVKLNDGTSVECKGSDIKRITE